MISRLNSSRKTVGMRLGETTHTPSVKSTNLQLLDLFCFKKTFPREQNLSFNQPVFRVEITGDGWGGLLVLRLQRLLGDLKVEFVFFFSLCAGQKISHPLRNFEACFCGTFFAL